MRPTSKAWPAAMMAVPRVGVGAGGMVSPDGAAATSRASRWARRLCIGPGMILQVVPYLCDRSLTIAFCKPIIRSGWPAWLGPAEMPPQAGVAKDTPSLGPAQIQTGNPGEAQAFAAVEQGPGRGHS